MNVDYGDRHAQSNLLKVEHAQAQVHNAIVLSSGKKDGRTPSLSRHRRHDVVTMVTRAGGEGEDYVKITLSTADISANGGFFHDSYLINDDP